MGERNVIQLLFAASGNLVALCDDGTIWIGRGGLDALEWSQIKSPPRK